MDQKKEVTRKFKSASTGQECSAAQYAAEKVCIRRSEKENRGSLEYKFWNKSHTEEYQTQVRVAHKLIKKFGEEALIRYINSPGARKVYSLGFLHSSGKFVLALNFVEKGVSKAVEELEKEKAKKKEVLKLPENPQYKARAPQKTNTLFSKIRNIENGKTDREEA
jgi:hypothetical protein